MKTIRLTTNAMMAAMCAVLGYVALDLGNLKITFESLPVLLAALMFGPVDGMLVGGIGTLIYQLLRYGVSATTLLWILPYIVCGLFAGYVARAAKFNNTRRQLLFTVVAAELLILLLNTVAIYADSKIYGYYSFAFVFGSLLIRFVIAVAKGVAFGYLVPVILRYMSRYTLNGRGSRWK